MNEIQTGSHGDDLDPWERFARGSALDEAPPWVGGRGRRRRPPARVSWKGTLAVLGVTTLVLGSCGTPAPAAPRTAPAPVVSDWSNLRPPTIPAAQRRIEVVDRIKPTAWDVRGAVNWLDRYTASDMVVVPRCSGTAYRCIVVKAGRLPGRTAGWAAGNTVTIDTAKVARSPYRTAVHRKRLLAHELAHTFGLGHKGSGNLMATTVDRMRLDLTGVQRAHLRAR